MSNSTRTSKRPPFAPFDDRFVKEESRVQRRASGQTGAVRRQGDVVLPPAREHSDTDVQRETIAERTERIDRKVRAATALLSRLPFTDRRARLLSSAILRRDEVLMDAVLKASSPQDDLIVDLPTPVRRRGSR